LTVKKAKNLELDISDLLAKVKKTYGEIVQTQREANAKLLPLYWDMGNSIIEELDKESADSRRTIHKISKDLGLHASLLYTCVRLAKTHTRQNSKTLGDRGLTIGHLEATTSVEDNKRRKELEEKALEQGWSVQETRKNSKEAKLIDGDGGEAEVKAKKDKKAPNRDAIPKGTGPVPTAAKFERAIKELMEQASNLVMMRNDVSHMPADDAVAFMQSLEGAIDLFEDTKQALTEMKPVLESMLESMKK